MAFLLFAQRKVIRNGEGTTVVYFQKKKTGEKKLRGVLDLEVEKKRQQKNNSVSKSSFRSRDLRVMGPARFRCANLLSLVAC